MPEPVFVLVVSLAALMLDHFLGEPRRYHPLVGFGRYAAALESRMNSSAGRGSALLQFVFGCVAWLLALAPAVVLVWLLSVNAAARGLLWVLLVDVLVLYLAIGWRSLQQHVAAVARAFERSDLPAARRATAMIVSRDTSGSDETALTSAALETTLENSSDALFASLFWYAVGGSVMVVVHRLANTLDAMWGYRTERFHYFGRFAARADDVLNFVPAQCVSLSFCLLAGRGRFFRHMRDIWWRQGWRWKSVNAGSVMATGAAALGISLGGPASYHGAISDRPVLGFGRAATAGDIERSFALVRHALILWFVFLFVTVAILWGLSL